MYATEVEKAVNAFKEMFENLPGDGPMSDAFINATRRFGAAPWHWKGFREDVQRLCHEWLNEMEKTPLSDPDNVQFELVEDGDTDLHRNGK